MKLTIAAALLALMFVPGCAGSEASEAPAKPKKTSFFAGKEMDYQEPTPEPPTREEEAMSAASEVFPNLYVVEQRTLDSASDELCGYLDEDERPNRQRDVLDEYFWMLIEQTDVDSATQGFASGLVVYAVHAGCPEYVPTLDAFAAKVQRTHVGVWGS